MESTPKSLRLHIALFGRTNVGKSTFLNLIAGQDVAITSPQPGTTTDVVEKSMELLPIGPVVLIDTAGLEDTTLLGNERIKRSLKVFDRADAALILCASGTCDEAEKALLEEACKRRIPAIAVVTKTDIRPLEKDFEARLKSLGASAVISCCGTLPENREKYMASLKQALLQVLPDASLPPPPLLGDLLPPGGLAVLIVPVDMEAPKGRLIMPQVQTIREALDQDAMILTVKPQEYPRALKLLNRKPDLVICDSQVVHFMVRETPPDIPCTTFSILFSRLKGDIALLEAGTAAIGQLKDHDKVLIAEACSHHAMDDDIGRVKIPRWLRECTGADLDITVSSGRDYPENLSDYKLVVHCGGCMLNRREVLSRLQKAVSAGVPVTNYGMCLSYTQKVLDRVMSPFKKSSVPDAGR